MPFHNPGDLSDPETEPGSPVSLILAGRFFTTEPPGKPLLSLAHNCVAEGPSLVAQRVNSLPAIREACVQFLGQEDPPEKEMEQ